MDQEFQAVTDLIINSDLAYKWQISKRHAGTDQRTWTDIRKTAIKLINDLSKSIQRTTTGKDETDICGNVGTDHAKCNRLKAQHNPCSWGRPTRGCKKQLTAAAEDTMRILLHRDMKLFSDGVPELIEAKKFAETVLMDQVVTYDPYKHDQELDLSIQHMKHMLEEQENPWIRHVLQLQEEESREIRFKNPGITCEQKC